MNLALKEKESREQTAKCLIPKRGSLVLLKKVLTGATSQAIVVSNDIQNESSDFILVVPLQRRTSRLKAPFAVDLGRDDGFRELHAARCDWVSKIAVNKIIAIERASISEELLEKLDHSLAVALSLT